MKIVSIIIAIALIVFTGFEIYKLVKDIVYKRKSKKEDVEVDDRN